MVFKSCYVSVAVNAVNRPRWQRGRWGRIGRRTLRHQAGRDRMDIQQMEQSLPQKDQPDSAPDAEPPETQAQGFAGRIQKGQASTGAPGSGVAAYKVQPLPAPPRWPAAPGRQATVSRVGDRR